MVNLDHVCVWGVCYSSEYNNYDVNYYTISTFSFSGCIAYCYGSMLGREKLNFVNCQTQECMTNYSTIIDSSAPSPTTCIKKTLWSTHLCCFLY